MGRRVGSRKEDTSILRHPSPIARRPSDRAAGGDPGTESVNALLVPRFVARHCSIFEALENQGRVLRNVVVRPEVEDEVHGTSVVLAKERLDVGCETHPGPLLPAVEATWLRFLNVQIVRAARRNPDCAGP